MTADDERVPPLTAQQLGLCGPLSDDPEVGPDTARHTPPADDQAAYLAEAEELCRSRTLPGDARGALDLLLAEYDRRAEEIENLRDAFSAGMVNELRTENERDVLSGLLRGMARRASRLRRQNDALINDKAAVRALHLELRVDDEGYAGCVHCGGDYPCDTLQALDGPAEAPAMRYELGCVVCATSPYFHLEPFESNDARQAWADAHQAATGHDEFRYRNTPVSVGPAEAAEPARVPACGDIMSWAGYTNVCDLPAGHAGSHQMGETTRWSRDRAVRQAVDRARAGSVTTTPAAPGYPRIADAITAACEAADIDLTVVHDGRVLDYVPGVVWLATVLDKAGLIDWTAFADETGSDTSVTTPAALALIDDLLRPWAYGYPVRPGYLGRAAQYVSVETLADWNARRAALASSAAPHGDES